MGELASLKSESYRKESEEVRARKRQDAELHLAPGDKYCASASEEAKSTDEPFASHFVVDRSLGADFRTTTIEPAVCSSSRKDSRSHVRLRRGVDVKSSALRINEP